MQHVNRTKIDYLIARIRSGRGNRTVLVAEVVKAYNGRSGRRAADIRVQGWNVVDGGAK